VFGTQLTIKSLKKMKTLLSVLLGLPIVAGNWNSECNNYNSLKKEQQDTFDSPCTVWDQKTNIDCGTLDEDGIWSSEVCRYEGKFPNGFRTAQMYMENQPPFKVKVPRPAGLGSRMVEILVETDTMGQHICVKSDDYNPDEGDIGAFSPKCEVDQLEQCFPFPSSGDLILQIYCDMERGCENDISFKYKIMYSRTMQDKIVQESSAENSPEMWCMLAQSDRDHRAKMMFPSQMEGPPIEYATHRVVAKISSAGGFSRLSFAWFYTLIGLSTLAVLFSA